MPCNKIYDKPHNPKIIWYLRYIKSPDILGVSANDLTISAHFSAEFGIPSHCSELLLHTVLSPLLGSSRAGQTQPHIQFIESDQVHIHVNACKIKCMKVYTNYKYQIRVIQRREIQSTSWTVNFVTTALDMKARLLHKDHFIHVHAALRIGFRLEAIIVITMPRVGSNQEALNNIHKNGNKNCRSPWVCLQHCLLSKAKTINKSWS